MELYAIIMAGGEGKRFWPLSRKDKPKQFLPLLAGKSLLRATVDRILPIIPIERVYVVTVAKYADETLAHIPELPKENLALEPIGNNTCPCIVLGAAYIKSIDPESLILVLPADHAIGDEASFRDSVIAGKQYLEHDLSGGGEPLLTFGIKPTGPETGYGYIKSGDLYDRIEDYQIKSVSEFTEKPDEATARGYIESGDYYWNSGIFMWSSSTILSKISAVLPQWRGYINNLLKGIGAHDAGASISDFYAHCESGSIDAMVLEKASELYVMPVDYPWSDLGSWKALDEYRRSYPDENITEGKTLTLNSSGCLIIGGKKLISVVGLNDVIVVETDDVFLVLNKNKAQDVKKVVEKLEKDKEFV